MAEKGAYSVFSNGRQNGMSAKCDLENSDEDRGGEQRYDGKVRTGYNSIEFLGELEDLAQEDLVHGSSDVKGEKDKYHRSPTNIDPLVESIFTLQSLQEAIERELQKFREMGEIALLDISTQGSNLLSEFASIDRIIDEASSSDLLHTLDITQNSSYFPEKQVTRLKQNVELLESKIEEANALLKEKEAKVIELEYAIKSNETPKEETGSTVESQQEKYTEMEAGLEDIFKQKIEAEVEFLAISRTIPKVRVAAMGQPQIFNEHGDAESKSGRLKRQAEELNAYYADIGETDQVLKLQNRMFKATSCFFVQTTLLFLVFVLFLLQFSPHYAGVVPT